MRLGILLALMVLCACNPSVPERPEGILPDSTMRNLIIEFSLADAAAIVNKTDQRFKPFLAELGYEAALKKQGIDRETLIRSLEYYEKHPKLLEKIYDDAIAELNKRQIQNR